MTTVDLPQYQLVIDGNRVEAESRLRYDTVDPYLGVPWASAADGDAADVDVAVAAARRALMAELGRREAALPARCDYAYRLVAPLFDGQGLIVSAEADVDAGAVHLAVRDAAGRMTATGVIQPVSHRRR